MSTTQSRPHRFRRAPGPSIPSTRASASPSATAASARSAARFEEFDAKLVDGRLEGIAKVASVNVDDENLAGHLQTPDFFDAEQYPELRFVSKSIERDGDRVSIEGDLTLRGVTKPVEITGTVTGPLENAYGQQRIGFDLETTVNRQRLRDRLEHGAPGRRPGARRRRRHHRQPRAGAGVVR